jgi:cell volume regulation protein A
MLAYHSELTFLVRSFFFVLLGIMAQVVSKAYTIPIIAILVALVVARWLAVHATRWSIRDVNAADTELLSLMFPRGLINAVLALQVLAAKGQSFFFMPERSSSRGTKPCSNTEKLKPDALPMFIRQRRCHTSR